MTLLYRIRQIFWFLIKIGIAGSLIWLLGHRHSAQLAECLRNFDYRFLAPAMICYVSHMVVCGWRWFHLARMLHIELSGFEAISLTFQGYFFSLVIPGGAIGGDLVKMGVLGKRSRSGEKMEGAFTVLMDRIIGMIALFVLALVLIPLTKDLLLKVQLPFLGNASGANWLLLWLLVLLCVSGLAASCVIFFHRLVEKIPPFGSLMNWGNDRTGGLVRRLTAATDTYAGCWKKLSVLTVVSIFFVHAIIAVSVGFLLMGLHIEFSWLSVLTAVTVGNIIGLLPFFPSGIGGRDFTTVALLAASGIAEPDAVSVQLLSTGMLLFFNFLGGVFFVLDTGRKTRKPLEESGVEK